MKRLSISWPPSYQPFPRSLPLSNPIPITSSERTFSDTSFYGTTAVSMQIWMSFLLARSRHVRHYSPFSRPKLTKYEICTPMSPSWLALNSMSPTLHLRLCAIGIGQGPTGLSNTPSLHRAVSARFYERRLSAFYHTQGSIPKAIVVSSAVRAMTTKPFSELQAPTCSQMLFLRLFLLLCLPHTRLFNNRLLLIPI